MYPVIWGLQFLGLIFQDDCDTDTSGDENAVIKNVIVYIHKIYVCRYLSQRRNSF